MSRRANPTVVGVFVVVALALAVAGIIALGGMQLFKRELPFVMFFHGDLSGLDVGSPVELRGVKIGSVSKIRLFANRTDIGVYIDIDPKLLPKGARVTQDDRVVDDLVKQGLRAQLQTQSLLTGQLAVYLDMFPNTPVTLVGLDSDVHEIPTVPTRLERLQARLEAFLAKLDKVNMDELIADLTLTIKGAREFMASPELRATVTSANVALQQASVSLKKADKVLERLDAQIDTVGASTDATLKDAREALVQAKVVLEKVNGQIEPLATTINDTGAAARGTLRGLDRAVEGDSRVGYEALRTLREVSEAARSLRELADFLERHPDALLRGKGSPEAK
jgi:paraquat-inducible protein B